MIELVTNNHMEIIEQLFDDVSEKITIISPFLNEKMAEKLCYCVKEKNIDCNFRNNTKEVLTHSPLRVYYKRARGPYFILIPMPVRQPAQIVMKTEPQDFRFLIQWA